MPYRTTSATIPSGMCSTTSSSAGLGLIEIADKLFPSAMPTDGASTLISCQTVAAILHVLAHALRNVGYHLRKVVDLRVAVADEQHAWVFLREK